MNETVITEMNKLELDRTTTKMAISILRKEITQKKRRIEQLQKLDMKTKIQMMKLKRLGE